MRFLLAVIAASTAAYALSYYLAVPANPEIQLWSHVVTQRNKEIAQTRAENPGTPIIFFTGGSSCAFSIDPQVIEAETSLPALNLGLPVAAGAHYILHQALEKCQPGDYLVVVLEPDLLLYSEPGTTSTRFSFALAAQLGHPADASGGETFGQSLGFQELLHHPRPGARYLVTLAGRTLGGKGYRYKKSDLRYRGHMVTPIIDEHSPSPEKSFVQLGDLGREILKAVKTRAEAKGVHIAYNMPWRLTQPQAATHNRTINQQILNDFASVIPVIHDDHTGVNDDPALFSDSEWHLTAQGARLRSASIAEPLRQWILTSR